MYKKKRIKINVSQRDIDAAIEDIRFGQPICATCPVARSIRRHKGFETSMVVPANVHENSEVHKPYWQVSFPANVTAWINAFDNRKQTKIIPPPFQFTIEVPECLLS